MQDLDITQVYRDFFCGNRKVIGWGTGSAYRWLRSLFPVKLEYIVDNNSDKWGSTIDGIEIKSPEALLEENPETALVLIYSSFVEQITEQIRAMCEVPSVPASVIAGCKEFQVALERIRARINSHPLPARSVKRDPSTTLVIQGPVWKNYNIEAIQHYRASYPDNYIIVSTWESTSPAYCKQIEAIADEVLFLQPPDYAGHQNRNFQIFSTVKGIQRAKELGAKKILKTRTDTVLLNPGVIKACLSLQDQYDTSRAKAFGLKNRIIVPDVYSRKYLPYAPSDIFMFGDTDDMEKFWSCPFDSRHFDIAVGDWRFKTLNDLSKDMGPAEAYFGVHFAMKIGWPLKFTTEDNWNYYRDLFIIKDLSYFDLFWYKYPKLPNIEANVNMHHCISNFFWEQLYYGNVDSNKDADVDINTTNWDEFYRHPEDKKEPVSF